MADGGLRSSDCGLREARLSSKCAGLRARKAITLVDVIAAIVILSVALPPLILSFADASVQSIKPAAAQVAAFLVTERMEEIIARRHQTGGFDQVTVANFPSENPVSGFAGYERSVAVTEVATDLTTPQVNSGLKNVVVTVSWDGGARQVQTARLFASY